MALVNGMILKGDDCPYALDCKFMENACNGEGCPFMFETSHFCDFSCGAARFFVIMEKKEDEE